MNVTLNSGNKIPAIGLGTWKSKKGEVQAAVEYSLSIGYRHIDCAYIYGNEEEVGAAIANKIADGTVKREDVFVTCKLWNAFHEHADVKPALQLSLKMLQLSYVDLYLIHWPTDFKNNRPVDAHRDDAANMPIQADGRVELIHVDKRDLWKSMEELVDAGLTKDIGLSNFNQKQIEYVLETARIRPAVLQIECHPYLNQAPLIEFCKSKGIAMTAYSPLASPDRPPGWAKASDVVLMDDPKIKAIATKYDVSVPQVLIRYQLDRGVIVVPKSVTPARIASNFDVFDFKLEPDDIALISSLNRNWRACLPLVEVSGGVKEPIAMTHKDYPFDLGEQGF
eukprot:GEMP01056330.1.p1 GENE.GEMP01056330.1~~GEMP01056330.1.p1  ORF type:complete len:362 (+),score=61.29 GEMP01056330.1:78-1088(+)